MSDNEGLLCACDRRGGRLHDFGPDCGPRVYPARRDAPDLPPVGELVQITTVTGTFLASRYQLVGYDDSRWWWQPVGRPPLRRSEVQSWNSVLVLPADELVDRLAARHWSSNLAGDYSWEQWQAYARRHPEMADRYRALASDDAAALRDAAIR